MPRPVKLMLVPTVEPREDLSQLGSWPQNLSNDVEVARFSMSVDNRTGSRNINVQYHDGRVQNHEWIARGLDQVTRFDPRALTSDDRNNAVAALLEEGLTQVGVAKRIGISQSRVSQIKKQLSEEEHK